MGIIDIRGLRKSYVTRGRAHGPKQGDSAAAPQAAKVRRGQVIVEAVKGIDLTVEQGEIFGFLGPNGAGKSTTLKMLATLLAPDGGSVRIAGFDVVAQPNEVRRRIGYVSQAGGTDREATGSENLMLQGRLYGLSAKEVAERIESLVASLDLGRIIDRLGRSYSGGERRKLDLALGMVHSPAVLFLDEPTTGLDPVSRVQLWSQIRTLRAGGTTVFITTHYLDEADNLCDRIAIIDKGSIVAEGTPLELKGRVAGDVVSLSLNHVEDALAKAKELLQPAEFVRDSIIDQDRLRLTVAQGEAALPAILRILEGSGIGVVSIALSRPSLDDVFLHVTGHSLTEAERNSPALSGKWGGARS